MGAVQHFPGTVPTMPAVARILARYDRANLEAFIAVAIDLIDTLDGPEDAEDDDPAELAGDEKDMSWPNRIAQHRTGPNMGTEDDEGDDFGEADDGY